MAFMAFILPMSLFLKAFVNILTQIRHGQFEIGLSGGVESMSTNNMSDTTNDIVSNSLDLEATMENPQTASILVPMGNSNENVVTLFGLTRKQQDEV